jgi:Fe-S-cluster containining protein
VRVAKGHRAFIREWCERDSTCPGHTRQVELDCLACGACCRDNRVVLEPYDRVLWRQSGRPDLAERPYVRTAKGVMLLCLTADGACVHLGPGNRCAIYRLRPGNCRSFPAGSEACLAARLDTLGIVD